MNLREVDIEGVYWIQWLYIVMNLWVLYKAGNSWLALWSRVLL